MNGNNHTDFNNILELQKQYAVLSSVVEHYILDTQLATKDIEQLKRLLAVLTETFSNHAEYSEEAVKLAVENVNLRLTAMNEFRGTVEDVLTKNISREEHTVVIEGIKKEINELMLSKAKLEGMATQKSVTWAMVIGALSLMFGLFALILNILKI